MTTTKSESESKPESKPEPPPFPAEFLTAAGRGALLTRHKLAVVADLRSNHPEVAARLDRFFVEQITSLRTGLLEAERNQQELQAVFDRLTDPPLLPARYLAPATLPSGPAAIVAHGNDRRVVPLAPDLGPEDIEIGDEVLLNQDRSVVVMRSDLELAVTGEIVAFQRRLPDGCLLVRHRDDELVVTAVGDLREIELAYGDPLVWDRAAGLALCRIERVEGREFAVQRVPDLPLSRVGGQKHNLRRLITTLTLALARPDIAARYGLEGRRVILMDGPPGTGKTLMAKAAAAELQRLLDRRCHIMVVKPGQWEDPYVGVTQQKIRECFRALRSVDGFGLLFLDEIESIGRTRGGLVSQHGDKFLAALLAEVQGFDDGEGSDFAVVAATNRMDLLDPALVDRIHVQLTIDRPDLEAAREIFRIHLHERYDYASDGGGGEASVREEIIERAVSRIYAPNGDSTLCTVRFRDNSRREISARELASGRCIEQICMNAREAAGVREAGGGPRGLRPEDIDEAVADALAAQARALSRRNIGQYVRDLPQDNDVVAVEPTVGRVRRPHRYLSRAVA